MLITVYKFQAEAALSIVTNCSEYQGVSGFHSTMTFTSEAYITQVEGSKSIHTYSNHHMDWKQYIVSKAQSNQDQCGQAPDLEFVCYLTVCQAYSSILLLGGFGACPQDFYMLRDGIRWLFWPDIAAEYPFHHCCILHGSTLQLVSQLAIQL